MNFLRFLLTFLKENPKTPVSKMGAIILIVGLVLVVVAVVVIKRRKQVDELGISLIQARHDNDISAL